MSRAQSCKRCHVCNSISGPGDPCKCVVKTSAPSEAMLAREAVAQWASVNGDPLAAADYPGGASLSRSRMPVHELLQNIKACRLFATSTSDLIEAQDIWSVLCGLQSELRRRMESDKHAAEPAKIRRAEGMWKIGEVMVDKNVPRGWMVGVGEVSAHGDYRSVHPTRNETLDWNQPSEGEYAATYKGASLFLRSTVDGYVYKVIRGLGFIESGHAVGLHLAMQMAMEAADK